MGTDLAQHRDQGAGLRFGVDRNNVLRIAADHRLPSCLRKRPGLKNTRYPAHVITIINARM